MAKIAHGTIFERDQALASLKQAQQDSQHDTNSLKGAWHAQKATLNALVASKEAHMVEKSVVEKDYGQFLEQMAKKDTQMVDLGSKVHALTQQIETIVKEVVYDYVDSKDFKVNIGFA